MKSSKQSLEWAPVASPVLRRLRNLAGAEDQSADVFAPQMIARSSPARSELLSNKQGLAGVLALQAGWAAQVQILTDGRRQIANLLLPGDIIAYPRPGQALAASTVIALTPVEVCSWQISDEPALAARQCAVLGASDMIERRCLINQITRIGRQSAYERMAHLLLELRERAGLAGLWSGDRFPMPITQEAIADVLGLTSVHINRTLQQLRQERHVAFFGGKVEILDPQRLMRIADYSPLLPSRGAH